MINRRFMIVPPAMPSRGNAEQLEQQAQNFCACSLKWRT
jgi:hypothetical protein